MRTWGVALLCIGSALAGSAVTWALSGPDEGFDSHTRVASDSAVEGSNRSQALAGPTYETNMIPPAFQGVFAQNVHDCGTDELLLRIKASRVDGWMHYNEKVDVVRVKNPRSIEVDAAPEGKSYDRAYAMELSSDGDEIRIDYTNTKIIVQRCSARAHGRGKREA